VLRGLDESLVWRSRARRKCVARTTTLGHGHGEGCAFRPTNHDHAGVDGSGIAMGNWVLRLAEPVNGERVPGTKGGHSAASHAEQLRDAHPGYLIVVWGDARCDERLKRYEKATSRLPMAICSSPVPE